jgi:hypothetical protein
MKLFILLFCIVIPLFFIGIFTNSMNQVKVLCPNYSILIIGNSAQCKWLGPCSTTDSVCVADTVFTSMGKCRVPGTMPCCKKTIFVHGCSGLMLDRYTWAGNRTGCL